MKQTGNMKKIVAAMAVIGCVGASQVEALTQTQDGLLNDPATWGGVLPGPTDSLLNEGWNLDVTTPYTTTGAFETYGGDTEITASGSVTAYLQHLNGGVTVNGGSLHSTGAGDVVFGQVAPTTLTITNGGALLLDSQTIYGNGNLFTMNHNGGTVTHDNWLLLKSATLNLNSGASLDVAIQLAFEGTAPANVFVNSNAVLTVGWVDFQAGGAAQEKITVNGGVFDVTENNAANSLNFAGANASVSFNSGSMVWSGITNAAHYTSFETAFDGWVDAGKISSAFYTAAEVKDSLSYTNGDAVATLAAVVTPPPIDLFAAQSGYLDDASTWIEGVVPTAVDSLHVHAVYDITLTNVFATTGVFESYFGSLTIEPTGSLTAYLQHLNGSVNVNGGSLDSNGGLETTFGQVDPTVLTVTNGAYVHFDAPTICGNGFSFTMNHDGGTVFADQWFLLKDATLNLNSGSSLTVQQQLALEGSAAANIVVNSGGELTVDWVHFQNGGASEEKITVDGGVFNIMTGNPWGSLVLEGSDSSVWLENDGQIVWKHLFDQAGYDAFEAVFNGWVDAGEIDSASWTDAELKDGLRYTDGNAVLNPSFDPYQDWAAGYGLTNSPDADMDFDYDLDGWDNLYEYGLGGNPTNGFIDGEIPTFELLGGTLEYTYAQRTDDSTLDYYLELTDDLTGNTWTNDGYSVVATNVTGGTFDYVTNHISTLDKDEKFIKLIIERP